MLKIKIPNNNINERKYILDVIFNEFLGLEYLLEVGSEDYEIVLENEKSIVIKDTFFNKFPNELEYLKLGNIPVSIKEFDMFSASFFMLTRWEEYVNKNRDSHNRFPATESLAYKEGFLDRPIVNESLEALKRKLLDLDKNLIFKKRKFEFIITHDVDMSQIIKVSPYKIIKKSLGDLLKRNKFTTAFIEPLEYFLPYLGLKKDPYDTFDYLMDISEKSGVKSHFFFMGKGLTKFDNMYDSNDAFIKKLILKIKEREHYIGIHPTYNAYNNDKQFKIEKKELETNLATSISFGREHFLRFEVPTTWQIWEDNDMKWDSTMSYADKEGFRCGVCYEYSVFNVLTRRKLKLKEKPLIVMEGSFISYQPSISSQEMESNIVSLINEVKKYNGEFVFLWHNSSFNTLMWKKYKYIYERVLTS